jgi:hypothetical protein
VPQGAKATLTCDECKAVYTAETDFLGDFEIRRLPTNKTFTLVVEAEGTSPKSLRSNNGRSKLRRNSPGKSVSSDKIRQSGIF